MKTALKIITCFVIVQSIFAATAYTSHAVALEHIKSSAGHQERCEALGLVNTSYVSTCNTKGVK